MCHSPVSITFLLYSFSQINATKFRYPTKTKLDIRFPTISWWKFYLSNFVSCQLHFTTGLLVQPICNLLRNATHWSRKYFKPPISHRRVFNASKTQPVFHKRGKSPTSKPHWRDFHNILLIPYLISNEFLGSDGSIDCQDFPLEIFDIYHPSFH